MSLINLPAELFSRIIQIHVNQVGVVEAWDTRRVNKTYCDYVEAEIFGRQSLKSFKKSPEAILLLKKNLHIYLNYRSNALYGAHEFLPKLVHQTTEKFSTILGMQLNNGKAKIRAAVSRVIASFCVPAYWLVITSKPQGPRASSNFSEADTNETYLCIAIALCSTRLINYFMSKGVPVWKKTKLFELPIRVASETHNMEIISLVLRHLASKDDGMGKRQRVEAMSGYIMARTNATTRKPGSEKTKKEDDVTATLIQWSLDHLDPMRPYALGTLFGCAMHLKKFDQIDYIVDLQLSAAEKTEINRALVRWRVPPSATEETKKAQSKLMKLLLDKNILDIHRCFVQNKDNYCPLSLAIALNEPDLVRLLLQSGANPDGVSYNHGDNRTWPLDTAIEEGNSIIVNLLLQYGADPEGGNYPQEFSTLHRAEYHVSPDYNLLLDAIFTKILSQKEKYDLPKVFEGFHYNRRLQEAASRSPGVLQYLPRLPPTWMQTAGYTRYV